MKHDTSHAERVARITFFNIWIVIGVIIIASVALNLIGSLSSVLLFPPSVASRHSSPRPSSIGSSATASPVVRVP